MNHAETLAQKWGEFVSAPWPRDAAPEQRVIFAVYPPAEELRIRANLVAFETATTAAGHAWHVIELDPVFAQWLSSEKYHDKIFAQPELRDSIQRRFVRFLSNEAGRLAAPVAADPGAVVAILGAGSLFGLASVKEFVDLVAPNVAGRLLVFFPGSCEDNNYRLLDGYDGWGYRATVITA